MKSKILYLECNSGISGDMTVAALLDLGADREVLMNTLEHLPLDGFSIEIKDVFKSGIRACDFNVILDHCHENHDHDTEYLHGFTETPEHHIHGHEHHVHDNTAGHDHTSAHSHSHTSECMSSGHGCVHEHKHHHSHEARNLNDIIGIIRSAQMTDNARALAIRIFRILAEAEAHVHGKGIDEVHFHEVGAIDSIVDIIAAAVCIDNLAPDQIVVSPLTDGTGQIRCQHGIIPVPVPAVAAIAAREKLILRSSHTEGELVTPTGAAIAAALSDGSVLPAEYRILKIGLGAGKREYATTGILRAMMLEPTQTDTKDTILTLETNIDDCTAESLAFTMQQLFDTGALDVFYIPIFMKKNRPAYLLKVICNPTDQQSMEDIIFRNTTTIGIRMQELTRTRLARKILALETPWGMADIKCCTHNSETYYYPESDSVCRLAASNDIGFPEMYGLIQSYIRDMEKDK